MLLSSIGRVYCSLLVCLAEALLFLLFALFPMDYIKWLEKAMADTRIHLRKTLWFVKFIYALNRGIMN